MSVEVGQRWKTQHGAVLRVVKVSELDALVHCEEVGSHDTWRRGDQQWVRQRAIRAFWTRAGNATEGGAR